ncbi:MAG: hypothetical protein JSW61_07160 [Candidatus Thorarchaeota archaeon]|nr:MAG: hypothetical protein JSW61_07160 [Candidatus Thorarchaeota archaeon]
MSAEEYPKWVRGLDILVGVVLIGVSFLVVGLPGFAEIMLVYAMSAGLLFIGFSRIVKTIVLKDLKPTTKAVKVITGIGVIVLASIVFLYPAGTIAFLTGMIAGAIALAGLSRIFVGISEDSLVDWARVAYIVVGILAVLLGVIAILFLDLGFFILAVAMSTALAALGVLRIASGVTGELR